MCTRAFREAACELGEIADACDAIPVGLGLQLALGVFPGPLGSDRKDGKRSAVPEAAICNTVWNLVAIFS
jgi:hypothetical protein